MFYVHYFKDYYTCKYLSVNCRILRQSQKIESRISLEMRNLMLIKQVRKYERITRIEAVVRMFLRSCLPVDPSPEKGNHP